MVTFYAVFIAGYFLLPMASGHRKVYYILVFPAVLLLGREIRDFYRGNAMFSLLLAYVGWMLASLLWTENYSAAAALEIAWYTLNLLSFALVTGFLWVQYPHRLDTLALWSIWLAAAAALVSLLAWYLQNPFPASRIEPLGVMHHQNKAACAYGIFLLLGAWQVRQRAGSSRRLYLLPCILLLSLVLLTQSRTALAAVSVGLVALLGLRALGVVALVSAASWALLASNPRDWWHRVGEFSFRPTIWQEVIAGMDGHWLLGRGLLVSERLWTAERKFDHAHNSYLATLRDGGSIGLLLLVALLATGLLWAYRLRRERGERLYLALLLYAMTCIAMDYDRLFVHPKELWLFFWLPLALVMAIYPLRGDPGQLRYGAGTSR
jgi:hypothetical protein